MEFRKSTRRPLSKQDLWVEKNLPRCPLCKEAHGWENAVGLAHSVKRNYFRCSSCHAVFSVLSSDILPTGGPLNLPLSPITLVVRIEDAGENKDLSNLAGSEHSLNELEEWSRKR